MQKNGLFAIFLYLPFQKGHRTIEWQLIIIYQLSEFGILHLSNPPRRRNCYPINTILKIKTFDRPLVKRSDPPYLCRQTFMNSLGFTVFRNASQGVWGVQTVSSWTKTKVPVSISRASKGSPLTLVVEDILTHIRHRLYSNTGYSHDNNHTNWWFLYRLI